MEETRRIGDYVPPEEQKLGEEEQEEEKEGEEKESDDEDDEEEEDSDGEEEEDSDGDEEEGESEDEEAEDKMKVNQLKLYSSLFLKYVVFEAHLTFKMSWNHITRKHI